MQRAQHRPGRPGSRQVLEAVACHPLACGFVHGVVRQLQQLGRAVPGDHCPQGHHPCAGTLRQAEGALAELRPVRGGMPGEYALLPIAESWYRPDARGAGDHVGLWQFGRSTAHSLGLPVNAAYDGRMDARASTDAAMRYLAQMHNRFGDWKLATAAFNAGPQRLQNLVDNQADALFSLSTRAPAGLPNTTFEHLAKMKALACLLGRPEWFGILLSDDALDPLVPVRLPPGQSSLTAIARQQEIPGDLLATLNPAFRKGFIASSAPRELLAPQSIAQRLAIAELPAAAAPTEIAPSGADMHIVRRGDTLGAIAKRHGVKLQTLFALNNLNARSVLRIGQRIRLAP